VHDVAARMEASMMSWLWSVIAQRTGAVGVAVDVVRPGSYAAVGIDADITETVQYEVGRPHIPPTDCALCLIIRPAACLQLYVYDDIYGNMTASVVKKGEFELRCEAGMQWHSRTLQ
jgi:hypothetical protein